MNLGEPSTALTKLDGDGSIAGELASLAKTVAKGGAKAGGEKGATAIFKGDKFRTASPRAKLNVDQAADLLNERGYKLGAAESGPRGTLYNVEKDDKKLLVPPKTLSKFLASDSDDIEAFAKGK